MSVDLISFYFFAVYINFSSTALSTRSVKGFENNQNICEKLNCVFFSLIFTTTHLVFSFLASIVFIIYIYVCVCMYIIGFYHIVFCIFIFHRLINIYIIGFLTFSWGIQMNKVFWTAWVRSIYILCQGVAYSCIQSIRESLLNSQSLIVGYFTHLNLLIFLFHF